MPSVDETRLESLARLREIFEKVYGKRTMAPLESATHMRGQVATLDNIKKKEKIDVVDVVQAGTEFKIPEGLSIDRAIKVLERERAYREATVAVHAPIDGFVLDAAHAFFQALKGIYGWVNNVPTPGFFGDNPPSMISVRVGINEVVEVPWGMTVVPGLEGYLETGVEPVRGGMTRFVINGEVKRKSEPQVKRIVEATQTYLREHSVFRGKAFRLRTKNDAGAVLSMPEPKFLDINPNIKYELVFSRDVEAAIATNIFTPIERTALVRKLGVPKKRGVLLSGQFGTGKSMTSHVVADKAVANGWTYILCERADELADMLRLAREYAPSVVFCEDIDRVLSGERTVSMDEVLNVIDGVEAKNAELMVILTTNHVEQINQAMLRPGRLDAVIEVRPPDAEAAERLMRLYGRGLINEDESIHEAGRVVDGEIPAVIQEVVERSKLAAVYRDPENDFGPGSITGSDLLAAALSMRNQRDLLKPKVPDTRSEPVKAAEIDAKARVEAATILANGTGAKAEV